MFQLVLTNLEVNYLLNPYGPTCIEIVKDK